MMSALEVTQERKDCWQACKDLPDDRCTGCPFRYTCEQIFPYQEDHSLPDYLPRDYILNVAGTMFIVKEELKKCI